MEIIVGRDKGRWPRRTRIRKVGTKVGALGPITASQRAEVIIDLAKQGINGDVEYIYWVEWDDTPGIPVAITDNRIEPVED